MTVALDFFKSKSFWVAVITTLAMLVWAFLMQHRMPTSEEVQFMAGLWMAVFVRDTIAKNAEIRSGVRDPVTKEVQVNRM